MTEYVTTVTGRLDDDAALLEALAAHQRRRPRDGRIGAFDPARWRVETLRSRCYTVWGPQDWRRLVIGAEALGLGVVERLGVREWLQ